jgi:hypothetical protein
MSAPFLPSLRQCIVLAALTLIALGGSLYMRYGVIENAVLGVSCDTGPRTLLCLLRFGVIQLFDYSVFGAVALAVAVLHLIRPAVPLLAIGLAVAAFGIVLYKLNVLMSGLAIALMILAFARPARRTA